MASDHRPDALVTWIWGFILAWMFCGVMAVLQQGGSIPPPGEHPVNPMLVAILLGLTGWGVVHCLTWLWLRFIEGGR